MMHSHRSGGQPEQHVQPSRAIVAFFVFIYCCATLQFVRFYVQSTAFYLNMQAYLNGRERLPFQERVLPIFFLRPLANSPWVARHLAHANGVFTLEKGPFYLLSLVSFAVAALFTQALYRLLSPRRELGFLVYPVFLFAVIWTYTIHSEANFSYPYDLPALAFFTAGIYFIYDRRFLGVLLVVLIGSFNRETTLFLIGIYLIDAAAVASSDPQLTWRNSFDLRRVPWGRVGLLAVVWIAVKLYLAHIFSYNDASEQFLRLHDNLRQLRPRLLPALLNLCGYTLPFVVLFHRRIYPHRFRNYLLILVPWVAIMLCSGVIVETRIYGELCSFSAVALVLIVEETLRAQAIVPSIHSPDSLPAAAYSKRPAA